MTEKEARAKLIAFGAKILYKRSLPEGLPLISEYSKSIVGADRCSMFIYDNDENRLWTTLADGVSEIVIPYDKGIVGQTLLTKESIIENQADTNPNFLVSMDKKTGYRTKNIITAPIFNANKDVVGILELLNKDGGFTKQDLKYMKFFAHTLSDFVELINLYKKD
jgi:GAF domain-containing protein